MNLRGRKVLITGASQGIGAGLANAFAAEGCNVYLVARNQVRLQEIANDLIGNFRVEAKYLALDMTSAKAIEKVMEFAGDSDVLINNAGSTPGGNLWDVDETLWRSGWELKVFGYINLTREMYLAMKKRKAGTILNNIGTGGQNFDFNYIAGTTGNAALMAFTQALGGRSLEDGIRVIGINPGPVDTERIDKILRSQAAQLLGDASRYTELRSRFPLGRPAAVAEIADLFVYLASERSGYTSGAIFTVDGGLSSKRSLG